jgi:deazaflavin-dependent oxidoreductase (nitroreductase family)
MLVTGSNFARQGHPAWTANLAAHPDAAVTVKGRRIPVHATRIPNDEIEAVWAYIERQWPGYRGYERASGRTLRIFRLVPAA